jgi:uncharacterized protein DUF4189
MNTNRNSHNRRRRAAKNAVASVLFAAGAAVAGTLGAAAPANADADTILAIVYSPSTGAYGWANGTNDPAGLYNTAMGYCQSYGGTDCRLLTNVVNGCGSLAVQVGNYQRFITRSGPTRIQSDIRALSEVPASYIKLSRCSTGEEGIG